MSAVSVVESVARRAEEEARRRLEEASGELGRALEELLYDIHPLTVFSRVNYAGALLASRLRPPPPDKVAAELAEQGLPTPRELAESLPRVLPTPKQLADAVLGMADPVNRAEKVSEIIGNVATPLAILLGAGIVALALALSR